MLRRFLVLLSLAALLGGCNLVVLSPAGDIARQQRDILFQSVVLMLLIILPVMALTAFFAWRFRSSNSQARYEPDWDHSMHLELVIWAAPLLIIICLGAITWASTHLLDPFRPLNKPTTEQPAAEDAKPLRVDVVALDWKWLFIYPDYGVGAVNEMATPVNRPLEFQITASSVMNSFYVPALAGQIYAMPAMRTRLHAVINEAGNYEGFSANYSGAGFSGMRFAFHSMAEGDFDKWVEAAKGSGGKLDRAAYLELERPSENEPVRTFGDVDPTLFDAIVNLCVDPNKMCMTDMMAIDAKGGLGLAGASNILPVAHDDIGRRGAVFGPAPYYVASICTSEDPAGLATATPTALPRGFPLIGSGLPVPELGPISTSLLATPSQPSDS
jgi:cytochrome o ubiquinol oxidase subunit 2